MLCSAVNMLCVLPAWYAYINHCKTNYRNVLHNDAGLFLKDFYCCVYRALNIEVRLSREAWIAFSGSARYGSVTPAGGAINSIMAASINLGERARLQLQIDFFDPRLKGIAISAGYRSEKIEHKKLPIKHIDKKSKIVILKYLDNF